MMTSSPDPTRTKVLRGNAAASAAIAQIGVELRSTRLSPDPAIAARLADPAVQRAFDQIADEVREAARAEGYAVGWAAGHQAANEVARTVAVEAERQRQSTADNARTALVGALQSLARAATELEQRAVTPAQQLSEAMLQGALELTEILLGREVTLSAAPGLDAVRRALDLVPSGVPVTARMHPAEVALTREALQELPEGALGRPVELVADASVELAGCIVECGAVRVDAQLSTALARVREALSA